MPGMPEYKSKAGAPNDKKISNNKMLKFEKRFAKFQNFG